MKIVIIGDGKVGHKLTTQLSEENYDVVLIDQNEGKLKEAVNELDIFCITGNGADVEVQRQADVPHADLVIACASTSESMSASMIPIFISPFSIAIVRFNVVVLPAPVGPTIAIFCPG